MKLVVFYFFLDFLSFFGSTLNLTEGVSQKEYIQSSEKYLHFFQGLLDPEKKNNKIECMDEVYFDPLPKLEEFLKKFTDDEDFLLNVLGDEGRVFLDETFNEFFEIGNQCISHWWKNPEMPILYFDLLKKKAQDWKKKESKGEKIDPKVFNFIRIFHQNWELLKTGLTKKDYFVIGQWLTERFAKLENYEMKMLRTEADNHEYFDYKKFEKVSKAQKKNLVIKSEL